MLVRDAVALGSDFTSHIARANDGRAQASVDRGDSADRDVKTGSESKKDPSKTAAAPTGPLQSEKQVPNSDLSASQQQSTAHRNPEGTPSRDLILNHQPGLAQETGAAANPSADKQTPALEAGHGELRRIHDESVNPANTFVHTARILEQAARTEMRIALRTPETGNLEVRTFIRDGQAGAVIAVERGEVRNALLTELPSLQASLKEHQVDVGQLTVTDYSGSSGATGSQASDSDGQQQPARHANAASAGTVPDRRRDLDETQQNREPAGLSVHA
jgi:flagellar hook-length control protein FliK